MEVNSGKIIAVAAPSGTGKTTIVKEVLKDLPELIFSISATTRSKRQEETNGKEYFFITEKEFEEKIQNQEFVEWERVYDYYYGTYKKFLEDNIKLGKSVLLEIDVKGALKVQSIYPNSRLIFIYPPSLNELVTRLRNRKTESEEDFKKRIERAKMELSLKDKFDYFVENKDLKKAILETKSIINNIIKEND